MKKPPIVFDFDGVVCDSTDECMVTAWNAWEAWSNRSSFRTTVAEFSQAERDSFRRLRPFVRGAGEYYVLKRSLDEGQLIAGFADYELQVQNWQQFIGPFKQVFYQQRQRLRADDLLAWINLHPVWPEVIRTMKDLNLQRRAYIATLKDGESVELILESQGIQLPSGHLSDQSQITNKLDALKEVTIREACPPQEVVFLDDNPTHLIGPLEHGYVCYLTAWGDTPADYQRLAAENSIPMLGLIDLPALLDFMPKGAATN